MIDGMTEPMLKGFAKRMKLARGREKVSQDVLARTVGVTRVAVSAWETGVSCPKALSLLRAASFLKVSPSWLLLGKD